MADQDKIRILHMEDDAGLARLFQRRLERAGFAVDLAVDGEQGLAMYAANEYHILVIDQRMPKRSGLEVIQDLSAAGTLPPTIMLTGAGSESVAVEAMKLGASDYIIKDTEGRYLELMPAVVERAVKNHRLFEEKRKADEELRRSKETIEALLNATNDMAALVEASGAILEFNQPFARLHGEQSPDLAGASIFDLWPKDVVHERTTGFGEVLRSGKAVRREDLHAGRFYDNTFYPVFGDDGTVVAVATFARDVTEQRLAKEALQKAHDELERRVVERTAELAAANVELRNEITERIRAEQQIHSQHKFLRSVLESLSHPFFVVDVNDFRIVEANSATGLRIKGEPPACHEHIYGIPRPCDPAKRPCPVAMVKKSKIPVTVEHATADGNGGERSLEVHAHPIFDAHGNVVQVIEYHLDITERKQAEQALTRTNTLLEALRSAQTQFISDTDPDRLFEGLLQALLSMTDSEYGFVGEVFTGSDGEPFLKIHAITKIAWNDETMAFYARYAAEGLEFHRLGNLYGEVVRSGVSVISNSPETDPRAGGLPPGHAPINSFLGLPFHAGDELIGMVGIANRPEGYDEEIVTFLQPFLATSAGILDAYRNRLRREWAEDQLRGSEERFRTVFESARDCIFIKDRTGAYTLVNPAMEILLDMPGSAIVGRTDRDIYGKEAGEHLQEVDARVLRGEQVEEEHTRLVKGVALTFLDTRVPMRNAQNEIIGICGIARNITDRKAPLPFAQPLETEYRSRAMRATLAVAKSAAQTDSIVLLTGESGSGKDYLARYIHSQSKRASGPFFSINCAAVPAELAESELFGHEAGAFTGAGRRKQGLLELAEGGTLLLNEIGELSLGLQAKLLTFLDTRTFTRVGGVTNVSVSARLIVATNRDLQAEVAQKRFRGDLYYRLNVFSITVPSLQERLEDLPVLINELVAHLAAEMQLAHAPIVDNDVLAALKSYSWPGNVRELRNVLERALMLSGGGRISVPSMGLGGDEGEWSYTVQFPEGGTLRDVTGEITRSLVLEALRRCGGSKRGAARLLGISHDSLYRFLRMYGYDVMDSDTAPR